jgi:hypothetical protein
LKNHKITSNSTTTQAGEKKLTNQQNKIDLAVHVHITLGWKGLQLTNAVAYLTHYFVTKKTPL